MKKRVLAFLMCAVMIFSSVPLSPLAEFFDFAVNAFATVEVFEVYFDAIEIHVNSEGTLVPDAFFNGEKVTENLTYKWTSRDTSIATVDENGKVKGIKAGEVMINLSATYTYAGVNYTYNYGSRIKIVSFVPVEKLIPQLNYDGTTNFSMVQKEQKTLYVTVFPVTATNKELEWTSSNKNIVDIVTTGFYSSDSSAYADIIGKGAGTATVTYKTKDGNKSGAFTVTVKPLISELYLPPNAVISTSSTGYALDYKITPTDAGNQNLIWSSDNSAVIVDALGVIKPGQNRQPGIAYVTAKTTDGSGVHAKTYVVVSSGTDSLTLSQTSISMKVGDADFDLDAFGVLSNTDNVTYKDAVIWTTSNKKVATVDAEGRVRAEGPGQAKITATTADGSNLKVECTVSVTQPLREISLPENEVCWINGTLLLTPVFTPENASDKRVTWSSDNEDVATVTDGLVSGKKKGTANITVRTLDGTKKATCTVSVEVKPERVEISPSTLVLQAGKEDLDNYTLTSAVIPVDEVNQAVIWTSSNENVATVDENGKVTAVAGGTAVITCTAKSGGKKATCNVTVNEDSTSIRIINPPAGKLYKEQQYKLVIEFSSATVTNKKIIWDSSNKSVLSIDQNGVITAREGSGSSVITATYTTSDGQKLVAECTVFVVDKIEVTGVTLNLSKKTVYTSINSNVDLYETVIPDDASDKSVKWSTSNKSVADVLDGTVIAKKPGVAKITVRTNDGGKTDYCTVIVIGPVEFYSSSVKLPVGNTEALSLVSDNPSGTQFTWRSSNESIATVDQNGVVKGLKAGTVTITATTPENLYSASCKVNVVIPVTGVKINATTVTVPKGEKRNVTMTISPANATDRKVTWSTPSQTLPVIEVNSTGQIEGKRVGSTTLTVTTNDGKYTDTVNVEVIQPVTDISFEYSSITLDAGKKKTLTPQIKPISATNKNVSWSTSNKNIATVDSKGVVTAVSAGTATITCTSADGYAKETVKVTVTQPPTGIKFNASKVTVKIGTPRKLNPTVLPETASNKNVIFSSSDEKIAKVAADGTVTGIKKGTAKITVTTANSLYSDTIKVIVEKPVKSVKLNKTSISIATGKTTVITATVSPKSASNKDVTWKSSDNDVVTVKNGKITAKAPGYAVITCTTADGGKTAECSVFVNQPVKSVKLNKTKIIMDIDDKITLTGKIKPSDASNKALKWTSSNKKVVKVTSKGVLKPVSTGTATVTVTTVDGGLKATCKVTVVKRVKSVSLPKTLTVYLDEKAELDAVLTPKKPSNSDVKWKSSKKSVATVSKKGVITPKKTGTANITVTTDDGGFKATCKVSVKRKLKSFTLNKKKVTLNTGATFTLKVNRKPSKATEGVTFKTSNKNVATVNAKGVITATGRGTATITAVSERGKIVRKCTVTVNQPVNSMYISRTSASVYVGESLKLIANVLPNNANNQAFTWSTSDASVVAVKDGTVMPNKVGTAVISARSANGKVASCTVTVKQHVNGISLDKNKVSLDTGKTVALKVTVNPANATEKGYTFSSSDTRIATVSASGVITANAPGTATVTVRSKENNKTATCQVTVIQRVIGIEISSTAETLYVDKYSVGETLQLNTEIYPADATNKKVIWSSSDSAVASVSSSGLVTAVKSGVALITATTEDGKKTVSCTVTVLQNVTGITLEKSEITVNEGRSVRLNAVVEPADAFNKNIIWTYENEEIATVDEYGWLTGVAAGKTTVYATTVDGEIRASCLVKVNKPVTGIELDITEVESLYRDNTVTLIPTVQPTSDYVADENINRDVIWTSSDESIAKVDENGVVTAVGAGEVIITATTVDGGFEASCKVTCFIPVEEIRAEDIYYVKEGYAYTVEPVILPENASKPEVEWTVVSGEDYFRCENGVITGIAKGNGLVKIKSIDNPEVTKTVEIRVVKKVESVTLDQVARELKKGETCVLVPTIKPDDAHYRNVFYASSDESVVTVSEDGTVTAVGRGVATVTVTTEDEKKTAECVFTVIQLVEEIVFPETEYVVGVGKNIDLGTVVLPDNANSRILNWESSDASKVLVNDGVVKGIEVSDEPVIITATAADGSGVTATVKVTVVQHAESIELTADTDTLWVGDSTALTAKVSPDDTTDKTVTYTSSDESIATVDSEGNVTAVSAGETGTATAVIKAVSACGSAESEYTFTVKQQITDIEIAEEEVVLELGGTYTFEPTVFPENAFDKTVTYISSAEDIISVDNGTVTAAGTGTATVTLKSACGKVEKQCSFKVIVLPVAIDMDKEIPLEKTKTHELKPVLSPDNVTETKIIWTSSDEEVATVDENGVVTALKAGTAVIRAQSEIEDVFAECTVTVYVNSEKIELSAESCELYIGEEFTLGARVLPEDTTDKNVTFTSSDDNVITVDGEGNVKATGKGTATVTVTAKDTGIASVCEVTVRKHVEGISMADDALTYVGRPFKLTADVLPADADNKNIIWKVSDTRTASIDENGVLTAHEKGYVIVTAETEDGGYKAVCFVEVVIGIDSVTLSKDTLLLDRGAAEKLNFSVLPANADEKKVIWTSSDKTVADVDQNGNVTATEKSGTAVIRATAADNPEAYAECVVTVKVPLELIYLSEKSFYMRKGTTEEIIVAYRPENATVKDVTFESNNSEVASVDKNGVITAHKAGEAYITVTSAEGVEPVICKVKVYKEIEEISSLPLVISKGSTASCRIGVTPYEHDEKLIYSCDDESIATVDEYGLVTAKAPGMANITVKGSISGITHSFTVTVKEPVTGVQFKNKNISVQKNVNTFVEYEIIPADANNIISITFESSDESVAVIIDDGTTDGTVQGRQAGTAEITITVVTNDGTFTDTYTLTVTEPSEPENE